MLKDFITLQMLLFINNCLEKEIIKSFSSTFKRAKATKYHSTTSVGTYQLKKAGL